MPSAIPSGWIKTAMESGRNPNVLVFIDFDRDGTRNLNEPLDITDASGFYEVSNLAPRSLLGGREERRLQAFSKCFSFDNPRGPGTPLLGGFSTEVLFGRQRMRNGRTLVIFFLPLLLSSLKPPGPIFPTYLCGKWHWTPMNQTRTNFQRPGHVFHQHLFNSVLGGPSVIEDPSLHLRKTHHSERCSRSSRFSRAPRNQAPYHAHFL